MPVGLILAVAALAACISGCRSGVISLRREDAGPSMPSDASAADEGARLFSSRVEPLLESRCGACHVAGRLGPDFLRPDPDVRTTLLSWPALVNVESPASSRLLTKGDHDGPALAPSESSAIMEWIEAEARNPDALPVARPRLVQTTPQEIAEGFNAIDLDVLGLSGSSIHFIASRVGDGMFLADLEVAAGPEGVRLTHPMFVVMDGDVAITDPVDRFAGLEIAVEPSRGATLDSGTYVLTEYPEGARLAIHFDAAGPFEEEPTMGTDGGMPMPTTDGCTEVDGFVAAARPPLTAYCTRCHGGGNARATAAFDLAMLGMEGSSTAMTRSCNEVLGRINPAAPSASGMFIQPDPAEDNGHPFKFGSTRELTDFRNAILGWFETEGM